MRTRTTASLLFMMLGCGESPGDEGLAGESCAEPDRTCPVDRTPTIGAPCEGDLVCPSVDDNGAEWTWECTAGEWVADGGCVPSDGVTDVICYAPTLSERCPDPFDGDLEGAIVRLGPGDSSVPFRGFEDRESTDLVFGPQGGAMVSARLEIVGIEVPGCVGVHTTVRLANDPEGEEANEQAVPLAMHCDRSNPFYLIVPANCDEDGTTILVDVQVDGIGSTSATLRMPSQDGSCG